MPSPSRRGERCFLQTQRSVLRRESLRLPNPHGPRTCLSGDPRVGVFLRSIMTSDRTPSRPVRTCWGHDSFKHSPLVCRSFVGQRPFGLTNRLHPIKVVSGLPGYALKKLKKKHPTSLEKLIQCHAVDQLARGSMKNAAKCVTQCELQDT